MNISYLTYTRLPNEKAHGIQIMKVCEALSHEVSELTLVIPGRKTHIKENPFKYYNVQPSFKILTKKVPDLILIGRLGFLLSQILFAIRTLSVSKGSTIVICQDEWVLLVYAFLGRRYVYEVHNGRDNIAARYVSRRAVCLVANSNGTRDFYIEKGIADACVVVFPNGVEVSSFDIEVSMQEARTILGLPQEKTIVLYTGHLYDWKGVDTFAKSAPGLSPDVLCVFVGGTAEDVINFKKLYSGPDNILILGYKPVQQIPLYLRAADVLVIPNNNIGESERFTSPMKLFEYMAAHKPIVASDLPSIKEILNTQNAFFFSPGNSDSLTQTISYVLQHPAEAEARSLCAFRDASKYTWNRKELVKCLERKLSILS